MRVYQHRKGAVMNSKLKTPAVEQLFDAILSLENKEECEKKTYLVIAEKRGASTATIRRVNRSLNYGSDGYEKVFERLQIPEGGEGQQE